MRVVVFMSKSPHDFSSFIFHLHILGAKDEGTSLDAYCWSHYTGKGTINKDNLGR